MVDNEGTGVEPFTETVEKKSTDKGRLKRALVVIAIIIVVLGLFFIFGGLNIKEKVKPVPSEIVSPTPVNKVIGNDVGSLSSLSDIDVPNFDISGPSEGRSGQELNYKITFKAGKGIITKEEVWIAKKGNNEIDEWKYKCDGEIKEKWCNLKRANPSKEEDSFSISWTPQENGTYFITADVFNSEKGACTGNLFGFTPGLYQCKQVKPIILTVK